MPRIALYARVSTTDQHPEIQINALRAYAEARSLEVAEVYVDVGISGAKAKLNETTGPENYQSRHFAECLLARIAHSDCDPFARSTALPSRRKAHRNSLY